LRKVILRLSQQSSWKVSTGKIGLQEESKNNFSGGAGWGKARLAFVVDFCSEEKINYVTWSSSDDEVNDEAYLSTLEHTEAQEARFQEADVHEGREADHQEKESEGSNSSCRDSGRQAVV
jgi:hypothetical protein